jgi:hypothetical protein
MAQLEDPVSKGTKKNQEEKLETDMKRFDISNLTMKDFKQLEAATARTPGPFEGYPMKPKIKVGATEISATLVVALNPKHYVMQDPSGAGQSIVVDKRDGQGKKTGDKVEQIVNLKTYHSRVIVDYEGGKRNIDIVFDRILKLADGEIMCAIVPSHSARAQLLFSLDNKTQKIKVDPRYVILDYDQRKPLRRLFEIIINPHLKIERAADIISGVSDEDPETIGNLPES